MPGFATSRRTLDQARRLMGAIGVTAHQIDIRRSALQMLEDIGHPFSRGEEVYDVTFENVQAGERTSHLFRLANLHEALVVGTGDLSELALGWCTYGVGTMSLRGQRQRSQDPDPALIRWVAQTAPGSSGERRLLEILGTDQPGLVRRSRSTQPAQETESVVGPFELQDFNLTTRSGSAIRRPRSPSSPTAAGTTGRRVCGPTFPARDVTSTRSVRSRPTCAPSSTASSG
jgi:NAD+ synthase (glutamine-hydrolysing)